MTLVEFLEARLAEDEAEIARRVASGWNTRRRLREVAAKRAIMREHAPEATPAYYRVGLPERPPPPPGVEWICSTCGGLLGRPFSCPTLHALASVYADHPDYDPAWAPEVESVRG